MEVKVNRLRTIFSCLMLCLLISCSSDGKPNETGQMIRTVLKTLNDRKNPAPKIDPRTVITRQMLDQSNAPLILIEVPERDIVATMLAFPGETLGDVWMGADGSTVTTMNGILVSSRGMSDDLMAADSIDILSHFSHSKSNTWPSYNRTYRYLERDNKDLILELACNISKAHQEIIFIFGKKYKTQVYVESCQTGKLSFQNKYWIDTSGMMRRSKQWHSFRNKYVLIERLI